MSSFTPPLLTAAHWKRIGTSPHHGINIFLPSLKTTSKETGDFGALAKLLPWVQEIGFNTIQLLPLNDSGLDPSPYNVVSVHALNPLFITEEEPAEGFDAFKHESAYWLKPYALFKTLKEKNQQKAFWDWPEEERRYRDELYDKHRERAAFYAHTQFKAHVQLKKVKEEASKRGLCVMGDLPILVSPDSVEVWQHPHLFDSSYGAGAPPDMYDKEGQRWGFPLHRFDKMAAHHFHWWKERLKTAENYYHLYRIDHVIGLFRLWAIPKGKKAKEGFFIPSDEPTWLQQGQTFLKELLAGSSLLPIAEDLGIIPPIVRATLKDYGIPSTKVMRWERYWDKGGGVIPPETYDPCSLTTVSTHDSETLLQWAKKPLDFQARFSMLKESHKSGSLFHVNLLGEYLALFNDLVYNQSDQERINIPGLVSNRNWSYRTRVPLEEIIAHKGLRDAMKNLIC